MHDGAAGLSVPSPASFQPRSMADVAELRRLYVEEQRSVYEIGELLGVSGETVRKRVHAECVAVRPKNYRRPIV